MTRPGKFSIVEVPDERRRPLSPHEIAALPKSVRDAVLHERFKRLYPERFVEPETKEAP